MLRFCKFSGFVGRALLCLLDVGDTCKVSVFTARMAQKVHRPKSILKCIVRQGIIAIHGRRQRSKHEMRHSFIYIFVARRTRSQPLPPSPPPAILYLPPTLSKSYDLRGIPLFLSLPRQYYGTGQCFLYKIEGGRTPCESGDASEESAADAAGGKAAMDGEVVTYQWTGMNTYLQYSDCAGLGMGGGGEEAAFGLFVGDDFLNGSTGRRVRFSQVRFGFGAILVRFVSALFYILVSRLSVGRYGTHASFALSFFKNYINI